jgi:hypothetical protein
VVNGRGTSTGRVCVALSAMAAATGLMSAAGCSSNSTHETTSAQHATYSDTCCRAADIDAVRHPGDVIHLHWTATSVPASQSGGPEASVRLTASLAGPFVSIAKLKAAGLHAPQPAAAKSIRTTDRAGGAPVSTLTIPKDAAAGFYNLTTALESGDGRSSGGHIIRLVAPSRSLASARSYAVQ